MARVVPVPLLSLFTGYELETMVRRPLLTATQGTAFCVVTPPNPCPSIISVTPSTRKSERCPGSQCPLPPLPTAGHGVTSRMQVHLDVCVTCPRPAPPLPHWPGWEESAVYTLPTGRLGSVTSLTVCPFAGVRQPGYPPAPSQVGGHVQRGGAVRVPDPVVLGGDGVLLQHRALPLPPLRVGPHPASQDHRRLPRPGLRHPGAAPAGLAGSKGGRALSCGRSGTGLRPCVLVPFSGDKKKIKEKHPHSFDLRAQNFVAADVGWHYPLYKTCVGAGRTFCCPVGASWVCAHTPPGAFARFSGCIGCITT